jgi:uncharacterized membrane protein
MAAYQSEMLADVQKRLYEVRGSWPQICTDLSISYSWLCKVAQKQIASPGVNEIERLHKYLSARFPKAA